MSKLSAIISQENGIWAAQLLELDIAVQSEKHEALLGLLEYMITAEYRLACHFNRIPFSEITSVPMTIKRQWNEEASDSLGALKLDIDVTRALAIQLEWEMPDSQHSLIDIRYTHIDKFVSRFAS